MTCRELTDYLMDFLDGALSAGRERRFLEHLDECPDCRKYLATYRETLRLIAKEGGGGETSEMPEDLVQAILDARRS